MPIPAALLAAPMIAQGGMGLFQLIKGAVDANNNQRPGYEMPTGMLKALASIQDQAGSLAMPGEEIARQLEGEVLAGAVDQTLGSVSSAGDVSQAITSMFGQQMRNEAGRSVQRTERADALKGMERELLLEMARYQDKAFDINEMQPFQDKAAAASALQGAGIQNLMGALQTTAMVGGMGGFGTGNIGARETMGSMDSIAPQAIPTTVSKSIATPAQQPSLDVKTLNALNELFKQNLPDYGTSLNDMLQFQFNPS